MWWKMSKIQEMIIEDQKNTIKRLQQECKEQTDLIFAMLKYIGKLENKNE